MYYLILPDIDSRAGLISHLKERGILSVFHYVPLHNSPAGKKYARTCGKMEFTENLSDRLLRLPLYHDLNEDEVAMISQAVREYFG